MEMVFSKALSPYYAWFFPEPKGFFNIGLMVDHRGEKVNIHALFDDILERHFSSRLRKATLVQKRRGAPIRYRDTVGPIVNGRVLLAGEAAGFVNSATGEGIPYALDSGQYAAAVIRDAVEGSHINICKLEQYQNRLACRYTPRLMAALLFRSFARTTLFEMAADFGTRPFMRSLSTWLLSNL
jgi:flavin-dependent dehydrogenase